MEKVAILLTYVNVCGAVKEKMVTQPGTTVHVTLTNAYLTLLSSR